MILKSKLTLDWLRLHEESCHKHHSHRYKTIHLKLCVFLEFTLLISYSYYYILKKVAPLTNLTLLKVSPTRKNHRQVIFCFKESSKLKVDCISWDKIKITKVNEFTKIFIILLINSEAQFYNFHFVSKYIIKTINLMGVNYVSWNENYKK